MLKLTHEHVAAISRAERDMQAGILPNMSPHHRQFIEDDIVRLVELKKYLLKALYEPGLPINTQSVEAHKANVENI